jgi:hypothetical protein
MVLGETLYELANSIRYMLGTPQKITLKNFSKVLQKQVNAIHSATLTFKDTIHNISDDVGYVGAVYFVNTNVTLQTAYMNRFYIIPTIMKGSIIALTNVINLTDDAEIITSGEITRLGDSLTFIINGNASITLQKKT